jgi:aryl-alcohol dehydrogenase-like predicted oxidoreductase
MEYTNLGSTGVKISRICLGCMTYGTTKWRQWVLEEEESRPFIKQALESGINFFDTADMYSLGASEQVLGRALKDFGPSRDKLVIATKVFFPMGDDPNQKGLSRKHIMHAIDDSLRRLGTDYVDLTASTLRRRSKRRSPRCMMWSSPERRVISERHQCLPGSLLECCIPQIVLESRGS